ncbi:MAG: hypothetical protein U0636_11775 [Phycisphaerales bacterium]
MTISQKNIQSLRAALALAAAGVAAPVMADMTFDFNSSNGGFTSSLNTASFDGPWGYSASGGSSGSGGWSTLGQGSNIGHSCTTDLTSDVMTVTADGNVSLNFDQRYSFEVDSGGKWDGGGLYISRNGGAWTFVNSGAFLSNGYSGTVDGWAQGSQLGGQLAFVGTSDGYSSGAFINSSANLGPFLSGDTLQIRFRAAYDSNTVAGTPSWAIDNVFITNVVPGPGAAILMAAGGLVGLRGRRDRVVRPRAR